MPVYRHANAYRMALVINLRRRIDIFILVFQMSAAQPRSATHWVSGTWLEEAIPPLPIWSTHYQRNHIPDSLLLQQVPIVLYPR